MAFFAVLAPIQLVSAWLLIRGGPRILRAWLVGAIGLIALYAISRVTDLPVIGGEYRVEPFGIVSKGVELVLAAALVAELRVANRDAQGAAQEPAAQT